MEELLGIAQSITTLGAVLTLIFVLIDKVKKGAKDEAAVSSQIKKLSADLATALDLQKKNSEQIIETQAEMTKILGEIANTQRDIKDTQKDLKRLEDENRELKDYIKDFKQIYYKDRDEDKEKFNKLDSKTERALHLANPKKDGVY